MQKMITNSDQKELQLAKSLLENPGIAAKLANILGTPIEIGLEKLPANLTDKIQGIAQKSLLKAADAAVFTMKESKDRKPSNKWHKLGAATSGGIGGFFGFAALALELPVSTVIMLRSITDIARSQGEQINDYESKLACLEVFALGGTSKSDDATENGYFAIRTFLAKSIAETMDQLSVKATTTKASPALLKFISKIAQRFGVQISEKVVAQAVPLIGAVGGAIINTVFIDHFQDMAKGHFIIRKLERKYSKELIKESYNHLD